MTEPHAGTDVSNYRTNTVINGDKVVLNGTKTLISRADEAHCFVVFTRVDGVPGAAGIGCVLADPSLPGLEVTARYHTMGGENLAEIQFRDMALPRENLIIERDGMKKLLNAFNTQRCMNPAISLGLAEGAFEEAVKYVRQRTIRGRPTGSLQGMRWHVADMARDIEVGRSILYRAAASADPFPDPYLAAIAKMQVNEMAVRVTSDALQVHGGYGFTDEFPVVPLLPRRALWQPRRRRHRGVEGPRRQARLRRLPAGRLSRLRTDVAGRPGAFARSVHHLAVERPSGLSLGARGAGNLDPVAAAVRLDHEGVRELPPGATAILPPQRRPRGPEYRRMGNPGSRDLADAERRPGLLEPPQHHRRLAAPPPPGAKHCQVSPRTSPADAISSANIQWVQSFAPRPSARRARLSRCAAIPCTIANACLSPCRARPRKFHRTWRNSPVRHSAGATWRRDPPPGATA